MERSRELEELVAAWFRAASTGDASVVDRHVCTHQGVHLIGSDPDEWLSGAAIADFLRGEVEGAAGQVTFTPSETEAWNEGSVGWASTRLEIRMPDGATVRPRWTAVFHREGDDHGLAIVATLALALAGVAGVAVGSFLPWIDVRPPWVFSGLELPVSVLLRPPVHLGPAVAARALRAGFPRSGAGRGDAGRCRVPPRGRPGAGRLPTATRAGRRVAQFAGAQIGPSQSVRSGSGSGGRGSCSKSNAESIGVACRSRRVS